MDARSLDAAVRLAARQFLEAAIARHGDVLPFEVLSRGFEFDGRRVPLLGPQGIFKPAVLPEMPLSIATAPPVEGRAPPYADRTLPDGILEYCYRGTDPEHPDNVRLRLAMTRRVPLIYLHGHMRGRYGVMAPVFVVGDDRAALRFRLAVDDAWTLAAPGAAVAEDASARRAYLTVAAQKRLHQQGFRERVLLAYRGACAVCRLRHPELLDAAHILPDTHPKGDPVVPNGLSLCRLHHAAFDRHVIGLRPDLRIEVRADVLDEEDGPMLRHGLQGFQGSPIEVPRRPALRPDRERVAERYEQFQRAS